MKLNLIALSLSMLLGTLSFAADYELARLEGKMGDIQKVQLLSIDQKKSTKLVVRTQYQDQSTADTDVTSLEYTIRKILSFVDESSDAVVTKTSESVCYMVPESTPALFVTRITRGEKSNTSSLDLVLTNVSCAFSSWKAPQSESGETSARILYEFLLEAKVRRTSK